MSGNPKEQREPVITLVADAGGMLERLIDGLVIVTSRWTDTRWALVGGLAVMIQLAEAHRATDDLDSVGDNDTGDMDAAIARLLDSGDAYYATGQLTLANDTKLDIITVGTIDPGQLPDATNSDRWFALSHAWAVDTAEERHLLVVDSWGKTLLEATAPIAGPGALVAMKLQSHLSRRRPASKQASDVYDIYRLLATYDRDGAVAAQLATAPEDLPVRCADILESTFVDAAAHWARQLSVYDRGGAMGRVVPQDLDVVGSLCAEQLNRRLTT